MVTVQYESPTFGKRNEFTTSIKLYPSPFSEYFTIEIPEEMEECHMQIMDLSGNVKYISHLNAGTSYHTPSLSAGIYIVNLRSLDKSCNYKVVKLIP